MEGNDLAAATPRSPPWTRRDGLRLHRPHPAGERRRGPTLAVTYPWAEDTPRRADLRLSRQAPLTGRRGGPGAASPCPSRTPPTPRTPRLLIAVGGALEDYTLQGYRDGGCDPGGELDGVSAAVTRYESTLREVLNALCPSPDTLGPQVRRRDGRRVPLQGGIF